jgi:hypothetical protein
MMKEERPDASLFIGLHKLAERKRRLRPIGLAVF